jgi:1-deoxy-D-xylulose-5-phosphate synthase
MFIEKVNSPKDLKKLNIEECCTLAQEIREALILRASKFGGHLASNLGVVELTIALHYVFDSPTDKFVFDVSHQCYTHKILTGRANAFLNEEQYRSVSGYTNPDESEHDFFKVGHTATSISLAIGLAHARELNKKNENVIAIIGDGSLSGGEALEGLDYAGSDINSNLIIVVNDNAMSIAENHGGIYKSFQQLRESKGTSSNNIFKAFGYDYVYVDNGHNLQQLIDVFNGIKNIDHPIVVHVNTTKGKGYKPAEEDKESYHWTRPFDITNGKELNPFNGERYDRLVRDFLIHKMNNDPKVVTILAAVPDTLNFSADKRSLANGQVLDVGIAEEHAIAMAAGIAKNGGKPVFATLATFYQRTYDQISQELCINNCAATMIVANASVYASNDVTHIGIFDIPFMANIPNLVYLAPTNKQEYLAMLDWSIEQNDYPVAIRAPRNGVFEAKIEVDNDYSDLNKYKVMIKGSKVAVFALGDFYQMGEKVVELLEQKANIKATLINPRYITGLDEQLAKDLLENHDTFVTLEDGVLAGGWGEKISSFYGKYRNVVTLNYGLKKEFLDRYNVADVLKQNRLDPELIVDDVINFI